LASAGNPRPDTPRRRRRVGGCRDAAALIVFVAACLLLAFVTIALVSSALSGVYAAAVYRFAAEGETGGFFTPAMVKGAFREK
jgi:hypothetical protein